LARRAGLQCAADVAMPANNRTLVWRKSREAAAPPKEKPR